MPEPIAQWWARRRLSRGVDVPYPVGCYREAWQSYPQLVRQYHPEFNGGIVLSQIPPAADVFLCWQCDAGHLFVATPSEQRSRPGRERRRSSWCPECLEAARPRTPVMPMREGSLAQASASPLERLTRGDTPSTGPAGTRRHRGASGEPTATLPPSVPPGPVRAPAAPQTGVRTPAARPSGGLPAAAPRGGRLVASQAGATGPGAIRRRPARPSTICTKTPPLALGEPFVSGCAPAPASAVEGDLRAWLTEHLEFTPGMNAIRLDRPFFDHLEAWPDVILPELRIAVEYDSTGRFGLEHVGKREVADRRKDRALRSAGWEVIRIRTGHLPALGPHDLRVAGLSKKTLAALLDELRAIRGDLIVDAYLRS